MAHEHGLSPQAAKFLTGSTLAEVEASAVEFGELLGQRDEDLHQRGEDQHQDDDVDRDRAGHARDPITASFVAKRERKVGLRDLLTGREPQQQQLRDETGKFTKKSSGFDGGARQPAPERHDPEQERGHWLMQALRSRSHDRGAGC